MIKHTTNQLLINFRIHDVEPDSVLAVPGRAPGPPGRGVPGPHAGPAQAGDVKQEPGKK